MFYGEEIKERVRERSDIVDLIGTYVSLKRSGSNYMGLCPFHNEKTPSFSVSPTKQIYYCFGCHKGGDIFSFLQDYENMTFSESVQYLAERAGVELPETEDGSQARRQSSLRDQLYKVNSLAGQYYYACLRNPSGRYAMDYLTERGVSEEMIKKFALGYAPSNGGLYGFLKSKGFDDGLLKQSGLFVYDEKRGPYEKFWNRVMFPIVDRRNHVIGFGGRVTAGGKPKNKYINSPESVVFDKSKTLYGINYIHGKPEHGIILCEGYLDVIALHQAGFTNAVAALGTAFTSGHTALIKRITDQVCLCFDSDGAGVGAAMKSIPVLKNAGCLVRVIDLKPHKDPDEFLKALSADEFEKRIQKARNSFFFETDVIAGKFDMDDPEQKTRFMNQIADKITEFEDEVERTNYIDAFSREYGVRSEDFRALVIKQSAKRIGMDTGRRTDRTAGSHEIRQDAVSESQGILLSWLCDHPEYYKQVKQYVSSDDFVDEPYHTLAGRVYEQLEEKGEVSVPALIGQYSDPEEQSRIAGVFHASADTDESGEERAIQDVIHMILQRSLDHRSASATDISEVQQLFEEKKRLQQLHITF